MSTWGSISNSVALQDKVKAWGSFVLGQFHICRLREKPIVIFATRRGGSTLLAEMIACQSQVDYINEPLNLWRYSPYFYALPHPVRGRFISLKTEEERQVRAYFGSLLSGRVKAFNAWNPFRPTWSFRVHRLVVKLLSANTLIDWLSREFDIEVVYLLRHPVAVASSCLRLHWGNDAEAYLQNLYFREEVLGSERARFADGVLAKGTPLEKFVLEWCLENLYPLSVYRERPWLVLTYEEIISRPREISELICSRLGLADAERMAHMVLRPSRTTCFSESKETITQEGPAALLGRWRKRVSQEDLKGVQQILDALGIRVYQALSPYPAAELCHFGALGAEE